jgi:predicted lipoprotein
MYRFTVLALAVLPLASCDNGTAAPAVDYAATLTAMTDTVVVPEVTAFATDADALVAALHAFDAGPTATTLSAAQAAWRAVRADWRRLDSVYFGPVIELGITERIDASPADAGAIEAAIASSAALDDDFVAAQGGFTKGLLGDEYLLFSTSGNAAALTKLTGQDGARRRAYAISVADEIDTSARSLSDAWTKDGATGPAYATQVKTAGAGSTVFPRQLSAMNAFANGIASALDIVTMRVRASLGGGVETKPAPTADPTQASDSTVADLSASLDGIQALWMGQGFAAKLTSASIASQAASEQTACIGAVSAIAAPFDTTLTTMTSVVQGAYTSCDTWKKTFNTSVTASLGLTISNDNDGD